MFPQPSLKPGLVTRLRSWRPTAGVTFALLGMTAFTMLTVGLALGLALDRPGAMMAGEVQRLVADNARQQAAVDRLEREADVRLRSLALRMSELKADSTRINALGQRLVKMGQLDDDEFDFGRIPALGGPAEMAEAANGGLGDMELTLTQLSHRLQRQQAQLDALSGLLTDRELAREHMPAGWPVSKGWISSSFGRRTDPFSGRPAMHYGVDFAGPRGADIKAVATGVVVWSGRRHGYGKTVDIDHGNGYLTRYAHNDDIKVRVGERVATGQVIAKLGDTGRATAPHLHFEVLQEDKPVNPWRYINADEN